MDGATLKLPPVTSHWLRGPWEVDSPATLTGWLVEFATRFPYDLFWAELLAVDLWQPERPDAPIQIRDEDMGGFTLTPPSRVHLSAQADVRACLAHELGHCAQHWGKVLPSGHHESDGAGALMHQLWRALPDGDGEEDFASRFARMLLGPPDVFMQGFPLVLARWRARPGQAYDPYFYGSGFIWWDGGLHRWERCEGGLTQHWTGAEWREVT